MRHQQIVYTAVCNTHPPSIRSFPMPEPQGAPVSTSSNADMEGSTVEDKRTRLMMLNTTVR